MCRPEDTKGKSWGIYANGSNIAAAVSVIAIGPVQAGGQLLIYMDNGSTTWLARRWGFTALLGRRHDWPRDYTQPHRRSSHVVAAVVHVDQELPPDLHRAGWQ